MLKMNRLIFSQYQYKYKSSLGGVIDGDHLVHRPELHELGQVEQDREEHGEEDVTLASKQNTLQYKHLRGLSNHSCKYQKEFIYKLI